MSFFFRRFSWRFLGCALILGAFFYGLIKLNQSRTEKIAKFDLAYNHVLASSKDPIALINAERSRELAHVEIWFYVLLGLIPSSFIILAIIFIILSSSKGSIYEAESDSHMRRSSRFKLRPRNTEVS